MKIKCRSKITFENFEKENDKFKVTISSLIVLARVSVMIGTYGVVSSTHVRVPLFLVIPMIQSEESLKV